MTKTAPTVAAAVVAAIMAADSMILSPGRVPRPRGFRVPLTDPTVIVYDYLFDMDYLQFLGIICINNPIV